MKLLVFYAHFGPYHMARARALLNEGGVDPVFLELSQNQKSHPWLGESEERGIPLFSLCSGALEQIDHKEACSRMREFLDRIAPDVVATAGYGWGVLRAPAWWALRRRRGSVLLFETTRHDKQRNFFVEALKRSIVPRLYNTGFVGGRAHRDYLVELGIPSDRIWGPHSIVDNDFFASGVSRARAEEGTWRKRLGLPPRYFVFVGRLAPEKNVFGLLRAYRSYRDRGGDRSLLLLGDGPQRADLERHIEEHRIPEVLVRGFVPTSDLPPYYAFADGLVLPSTIEPWGLVVNEAMAAGLPVVASETCGSAPDLVGSANGFLFSPGDTDGLAALLMRVASMAEEERRALGKESERIIQGFGPQQWAKGLMSAARAAREARGG
ncbi:glycosyltransferase family 4 protein [Methylacidimicrobium sp. B4]|uniref:glycosyltransferase family 4 protein n=1 Tax=Methylacidimicrobium sp. B4 TaxID=2796139 RepID=UPI001A8F475B|nr:glycosyltransferase family 4 protein [Methylacidimicrobium sp. B4]QSR85454.1 glycosyltransferase family 4 protein [Methylacidimicrobium sp. B4]